MTWTYLDIFCIYAPFVNFPLSDRHEIVVLLSLCKLIIQKQSICCFPEQTFKLSFIVYVMQLSECFIKKVFLYLEVWLVCPTMQLHLWPDILGFSCLGNFSDVNQLAEVLTLEECCLSLRCTNCQAVLRRHPF